MNPLSLTVLLAALLPAAVLMALTLRRDSARPEPPRMLLRGFAYGMGSGVLVLALSSAASLLGLAPAPYASTPGAVRYAFVAAAIPEETCKLLALWLLLRRNPYFDEHLDGIVYSVCVGLGFAALENVLYLFGSGDQWFSTAVLRGLLAVPGHFFFAVLMGYYYSLLRFGRPSLRRRLMVLGAPVLTHGIYDTLVMSLPLAPRLELLFTLTLLLFCNALRKVAARHIRELAEADRRAGFSV